MRPTLHSRGLIYSIYRIEGPSGVYIGCTRNPKKRWQEHCSEARRGTRGFAHSMAMQRDGIGRYTFTVVAQTTNVAHAAQVERLLICAARDAGETVLNTTPYAVKNSLSLGEWFANPPTGSIRFVSRYCGIAYSTAHALVRGKTMPKCDTIEALQGALAEMGVRATFGELGEFLLTRMRARSEAGAL